jgi:type IV pilus assembly protein PilO
MAIKFSKIVEDFKRLNPRDPGTWPAIPKLTALAAVLIVLPVAAYFLDWQSQLDELNAGQQQEKKLKDDYVNKKRQAINLELYRQQLREIDTQFGALLRQLPNKSQMDALLVDINQAGLGRVTWASSPASSP